MKFPKLEQFSLFEKKIVYRTNMWGKKCCLTPLHTVIYEYKA